MRGRRAFAWVGALACGLAAGAAAAGGGTAVASRDSPQACVATTNGGVLPTWARAGFSSPTPRPPHVIGRRAEIAAILFGYPLASPPAVRRNNKILWVSRRLPAHPTALWIRAQRMVGARAVGRPVTRRVQGGPGPSIVDLPTAGCWRLRLAWAGRTDTLDLRYRVP